MLKNLLIYCELLIIKNQETPNSNLLTNNSIGLAINKVCTQKRKKEKRKQKENKKEQGPQG